MLNGLESDTPIASETRHDTTTPDSLLLTAKSWFRQDREHAAEWREQAREDFDFVAGHQWSEEDRNVLREQMRPEITFNRIAPTVESVVGIEIGNRREVRYIPRSAGDEKPDEVLTAAGQWAREQCDAEDEETDAFFDVIVCGMGWVDTRMDFEEDPDGRIVEERIDPLEMFWDASARKRNLADARRTWRVRTMPIEDARLLAPDADDADLDAAWARSEDARAPHNADPEVAYHQDVDADDPAAGRPGGRKDVTIVHLQWWERESYYRVAFNGRIESVAEDDFPTFRDRADKLTQAGLYEGPPMQAVRQVRKVYRQALIGATVLSFGPGPCAGHFSWECITGKRDHNKGTWYGLVRAMKDPQRWANKWLSQSLHILNTNAKGGIFAERGAFENDRDAEESYARSDRITWLKSGALAAGRIQPKSPPAMPVNLWELLQYAITSIRDVSGVNVELLGLREADQPATLEESRKQSGMAILASLFDSLRRYRKRQGRILLYFILTYLSDGRLVRIVGEDGAKYVPLIHQPGLVEYDVIVDDQATSPNQKERVWATLMQMMPMLGSTLDASDWAVLFEYSPLPASIVEKWQEKIKAGQAAEAPLQQQMQQLQSMLAQAKIALTEAQAEEAQATAAATAAKAGTPDAGAGGAAAQIDYEQGLRDTETDRLKIVADLAARREKTTAEQQTEREWMASDQAVQAHRDRVDAAAKMVRAGIAAAHGPRSG